MKKIICLILAIIMSFSCFTACKKDETDDGKLSVIATIFPEYDWVKNIMGELFDSADVTLLLDNGVDLHSYQPSAADIVKISSCNIFIYAGGESDAWVDDILKSANNKNMTKINLLEVLGESAKEEEIVEGMEGDHDHDEDEEEKEYDEHVWLSLKNTVKFCNVIKDALCKADEANKDVYAANAEQYIKRLNDLDAEYKEAIDNASTKTLLFGDRFPFRYLVDDYGLNYYAAFSGCSAESEASFETIAFLAGKLNELGLSAVMTIEGSSNKIAETIISTAKAANTQILSVNSMQSVTAEDVKKGADYISIMKKNLDVLKEALN